MSLNILIGGDFFPGRSAEPVAISNPSSVWGDSIDLLRDADLSIINLEAPLTDSDNSILKTGPNIKLSPKCIDTLKVSEIDVVTLANNHVYDYGIQGLEDTLNMCVENGIETVGAGLNLSDAQETLYKAINGKTIAVVNFAENEWSNATEEHGGANPMDLIDNARQIKEANSKADIVLVIVHGGHELYHYPSPRMVKQYRFYAEQGASAIIGHHTHCASGHEVHNGVPIFYSLGNLFFPSKTSFPGWYEGMLLKLKVNDDLSISWDLIPYQQCADEYNIKLLIGDQKKSFNNKLDEINKVIADEAILQLRWEQFISKRERGLVNLLMIPLSLLRIAINKSKLKLPRFLSMHCALILNLFRCEAHRDIMLSSLNSYVKGIKK